jgi:hypothetical protein
MTINAARNQQRTNGLLKVVCLHTFLPRGYATADREAEKSC